MTRRDLAVLVRDRFRSKFQIDIRQAEEIVDCVLGGIMDGVLKDGRCQVMGFGTFRVKDRAARRARNPGTGDMVDVPAKKVVVFKPALRFSNLVQGKGA